MIMYWAKPETRRLYLARPRLTAAETGAAAMLGAATLRTVLAIFGALDDSWTSAGAFAIVAAGPGAFS
ncbi:hypothetical protein ACFVHB_12050 [Kitasatospora sp. NPDC127111]|uniref:hypothetical protein n=1 Tax=Kitasatospora sp. NPDC127111 TaxID=3345363 RepID=UPI00362CAB9D